MVVDAKDAYEEALKVEPTNAQAKSGLKAVDEAIAREAAEDGQEPDLGIGKVRRSFRRQRLRVDVQ
jgi:stress-induced-phosphoprotein 1